MGGNEQTFCDALEVASQDVDHFRYLEIGLGNCGTLRAVAVFLDQLGLSWEAHGVDLPGFQGKVFNTKVTIHPVGSEAFLELDHKSWHFAFIDACHGKACAMREFLAIEPWIEPGGVVCFHDTDPHCQGRHMQPHCGTGIDVRAAVEELGLLGGDRQGWEILSQTPGRPPNDHGATWFRRARK